MTVARSERVQAPEPGIGVRRCDWKERLLHKPARDEPLRVAPIEPGLRTRVSCDVVIPVGEASLPWLGESVNSALNQVWADVFVHVVADALSAAGYRAVRRLGNRSAVAIYRARRRLGPYRIVNSLFDRLRYDFFCVQDADDLAAPNRVWRSVRCLVETGSDFYGGALEQFVDHSCDLRQSPHLARALVHHPLHRSGHRWRANPFGNLVNGAMTVRRRAFEALNGYADLDRAGDVDFANRVFWSRSPVHVSDHVVGWRRLHDRSLSEAQRDPARTAEAEVTRAELATRLLALQRGSTSPQALGALDRLRRQELLELVPFEDEA